MILLTLALPVYNDATALQGTIESILQGVSPSNPSVEIVVSDNNSADGAYSVSSEMLAGYKNATVIRQKTNIGFAGNLKALAECSRGEYIWFVGAGDTLVPNQLREILRFLEKHMPDFGTVHGRFNFHRYWEYEPPEQKLRIANSAKASEVSLFNHALSMNIMKRSIMIDYDLPLTKSGLESSAFLAGELDPLRLWESETSFWPHLEAICQYVERKGLVSSTWFEYHELSVLLNHNKNGTWDKGLSAMKIFVQWAEITERTRRAIPTAKWIENLDKELRGKHLLKFLFMLRKDQTLSPTVAMRQIEPLKLSLARRTLARMIVNLPRLIVTALVSSREGTIFVRRAFSRK